MQGFVRDVLAVSALALATCAASAQPYPSKPIRFIVGNAPGGSTDILARLFGQRLTESFGQPVIIDNRPGANSIVGTDALAKSPPDGSNWLFAYDTHAVNPFLQNLPFDTEKDLAGITLAAVSNVLISATPSWPAQSIADVIALAKKEPGKLAYASPGSGSSMHLAMELLKGKDLVPYTKPDNLLPIDKVVSVIARVADALGYAHTQNIVHRDIKPANVMYEPESDSVKVADFGIARITDSSKTKTGMVLGTPSYMSPEQLSGKKVDGKSDLFSLAVSLYQMACGQLPFEGDSMAQLMYKIANEPPPDILGINPALPPAFVAFLDKAMAKEAGQRYQTGEEFATALRATLAGARPAASKPAVGSDVDISL